MNELWHIKLNCETSQIKFITMVIVPRHGEAIGGDIEMLGMRPSVCPSVRTSVHPSVTKLVISYSLAQWYERQASFYEWK